MEVMVGIAKRESIVIGKTKNMCLGCQKVQNGQIK